jgi:ABC-2 type transport system permease protein
VSAVTVFVAFVRRDWRIDLSYRATFALRALSTVLALTLFFYLSRVVDNARFATHQDLRSGYFGYVAVGLSLLRIIQVGLGSLSRKLRDEQTTGTFEALMATPTSPALIILSSAVYDLARATLDGLLLIAAAILIFGLDIHADAGSILVATMALLGCVALFAALGVAVAALTVIFKRTTVLLGFVVTALALLGGVYFPIEVMPDPIEGVAKALPFTWGLDVTRASLLGGDVDPTQLAGLFGSVALLLPLSLLGFRASVWRARRTGSLAHY